MVVLHHFLFAFYPILIVGPGSLQHSRIEDNIHGTPLALLFSGTFAVAVFFVLSGFVLTIGFFQTKNEKIIKKLALKRYPRLMIPALIATLICYILIKLGSYQHISRVAEISGSGWLGAAWNFNPNFFNAVYSGTIGIFIEGGSPYDNVLWTMITEFAGSFIVFAFVLLFGASKYRWISYVIVSIFTFNTWFLPFIFGMALADLQSAGRLHKFKNKRWTVGASLAAIIFGSFPVVGTSNTIYAFMNHQIFSNIRIDYNVLYLTLGATFLIFTVLISKRLSTWLEKPKVSKLGKYTFSLYLIHVPILYSLCMVLFSTLIHHMGYNSAFVVTALVSAPVVVLGTILFERYVDAPAVRLSSVLGKIFENEQSFEFKKYIRYTFSKLSKLQIIFLRPQVKEYLED